MDKKTKTLFREIMREIGSKGGKIGGKRSLETMTAEERSARAKKASLAAAKKRTGARLARGRAAKRKCTDGTHRRGPNETWGRFESVRGVMQSGELMPREFSSQSR